MNIKTIYKYIRPDGGTTVSPNCPEQECQTLYRIIAETGFGIRKNDMELVSSIDVEDTSGWVEEILPPEPAIEPPTEETPEEFTFSFNIVPQEETITNDNTPLQETLPQSFILNQEEYLEWKDYKSRVSTLEYQLSLVLNALKAQETIS